MTVSTSVTHSTWIFSQGLPVWYAGGAVIGLPVVEALVCGTGAAVVVLEVVELLEEDDPPPEISLAPCIPLLLRVWPMLFLR